MYKSLGPMIRKCRSFITVSFCFSVARVEKQRPILPSAQRPIPTMSLEAKRIPYYSRCIQVEKDSWFWQSLPDQVSVADISCCFEIVTSKH